MALYFESRINKNALLQTAFMAILPTGLYIIPHNTKTYFPSFILLVMIDKPVRRFSLPTLHNDTFTIQLQKQNEEHSSTYYKDHSQILFRLVFMPSIMK